MKKIKVLIIVTVIIIIILIVSIILLINNIIRNELSREQNAHMDIINNPGYSLLGKKPEKVELENMYFSAEACIEKAISYANEKNNIALYNLINKNHIEEKKITQDNVIEEMQLSNIEKYRTEEIYQITGKNYISFYINIAIKDNQNRYYNVNWDSDNSAYDIRKLTNSEYDKYINTTIEDVKSEEEFVKRNDNNSIPYKYLTKDDLVERYFNDYINIAINFPEIAYNKLDEQYKKAKFGNIENYKEYVKNNTKLNNIYKSQNMNPEDFEDYKFYILTSKNIGLEKYSINKNENYTQYICIDSYGSNYIFSASTLMDYKLILDTYTIDIPEFLEKYNKATEQEKVILNLNKFMLALNDGDYKYAYSVLADSFKTNNFKTQQDFENYAKSNFFTNNKFDYTKFGNDTSTYYTYDVTISDADGKDMNTKTKKFIMVLGSGTDFEISFNV